MAGGSSLSPLTGPADSVRRALGAAILNADSLKETPAAGLTRAGVPVRGTPSPAGTTRFAGDDIAEAFQRADLVAAAGPSLKGFIDSMQSGPFALSLPGAEPAAGAAKSAPKPQGAPGGMA
jgi:hypothetical protein